MSNLGKIVHYVLPNDPEDAKAGGRDVAAIVLSDPMGIEHRGKSIGTTKTELRIYPSPHRDRVPEQVVQADHDPSGKPGTWHFIEESGSVTVTASDTTVETSGSSEEAN